MNNINLNPFLRKLDFYLLKRFSKNFFMFFLILISIIFLIEFVELLRRTSENANIQSVHQVLYLSALKLSGSVIHVLPFVIFVTTMYTAWRFNRNREMVIIQNIGINSFKILYPFVFFSLLLGVFYIFILNPFLSYGVNSYEKIEQKVFRGKLSESFINKSGVWLRQGSKENKIVIRASSFSPDQSLFENITFYIFTKKNNFVERIDSKKAELKENYWHMNDVIINRPNKKVVNIDEYTLSTNLSIDKIESSFLDPESISILKLPNFIELLEQSGFSSTKHSIYKYKTYCLPFFFVGLILLAGAFTAKFTKNKKESVLLLLFCAVFGFLIYVVSEYIYSLGIADKLPTILASVSPSIITIVIGIYFIIYFENVN